MYISIHVRMDENTYYCHVVTDLNLLQVQSSQAELNSLENSKRRVGSNKNQEIQSTTKAILMCFPYTK